MIKLMGWGETKRTKKEQKQIEQEGEEAVLREVLAAQFVAHSLSLQHVSLVRVPGVVLSTVRGSLIRSMTVRRQYS